MVGALESQQITGGCVCVRLHGHLKRAAGLSVEISADHERSRGGGARREARLSGCEAEVRDIHRVTAVALMKRCRKCESRGTAGIRQRDRPISRQHILLRVSASAGSQN